MTWLHTVLSYIEPLSHGGLALVIVLVMTLEQRWPLRAGAKTARARQQRWLHQLAIYALGAVLMYFTGDWLNPAAIALGSWVGWSGLAGLSGPVWLNVTLGVLVVDALHYASHRAAHVVPWWWRLHKLHHSDTHVDASTTLRHHPLESLFTGFFLLVCYAALGLPLYSILIHGLLVLLHGPFSHANIRLKPSQDHALRWLIITPGMHRIHHSVRMDEGNSNFGSVLTWWDRLLGTCTAEPQGGQAGMALGLPANETRSKPSLLGHLTLPFQAR
jgi:sterol desaturase/sphingolipid hydroxylase (fatty acid hydroxylase superfamily)